MDLSNGFSLGFNSGMILKLFNGIRFSDLCQRACIFANF